MEIIQFELGDKLEPVNDLLLCLGFYDGVHLGHQKLIKKAKEMGIYTIVVSIPGNYPGFALADQVIYANTVDCKQLHQMELHPNAEG